MKIIYFRYNTKSRQACKISLTQRKRVKIQAGTRRYYCHQKKKNKVEEERKQRIGRIK
jgi:hypothetical protein